MSSVGASIGSSANTPLMQAAWDQINALHPEVQARIFSFLVVPPGEQAAVHATINRQGQHLSCSDRPLESPRRIVEAPGVEEMDRLSTLSSDLVLHIGSFLVPFDSLILVPNNLKGVSSRMCHLFTLAELQYFATNEMTRPLIPGQPPLAERKDCRQMLSSLVRVISAAKWLSDADGYPMTGQAKFSHLQTFIPLREKVTKDIFVFTKHSFPERQGVLMCALHVLKEPILARPQMEPSRMTGKMQELVPFIHLENGGLEAFNKSLDTSPLQCSISFSQPNNCYSFAVDLLSFAAQKDQETAFAELLERVQRLPVGWEVMYCDSLLERLARLNVHPKYVAALLRTSPAGDLSYAQKMLIGNFDCALEIAASLNHRAFLEALFAARPGTQITRQNLEHIWGLVQPFLCYTKALENAVLSDSWQCRLLRDRVNTFSEDRESARAIMALVDLEIDRRYPYPPLKQLQEGEPAAPAAAPPIIAPNAAAEAPSEPPPAVPSDCFTPECSLL